MHNLAYTATVRYNHDLGGGGGNGTSPLGLQPVGLLPITSNSTTKI